MEIKELSFMENLSGNGKEAFARNGLVGGHSYSSSSDYDSYSSHPFFEEIIIDFDFGSIVVEVPQAEPEPEPELVASSIHSGAGLPKFPPKRR